LHRAGLFAHSGYACNWCACTGLVCLPSCVWASRPACGPPRALLCVRGVATGCSPKGRAGSTPLHACTVEGCVAGRSVLPCGSTSQYEPLYRPVPLAVQGAQPCTAAPHAVASRGRRVGPALTRRCSLLVKAWQWGEGRRAGREGGLLLAAGGPPSPCSLLSQRAAPGCTVD
jgi:hypothetical protein